MIITSSNLVDYLIERGLVSCESVVDGDVMVVDATRRNRNFKVLRKNSPSYFVKQIKDWEPQAIATLQCEATCYWLAQNEPALTTLAELMPQYYCYDAQRQILVTELLPEAENLAEYHRRLGQFPISLADQLGRSLGIYHRVFQHEAQNILNDAQKTAVFTRKVPWVLSVHQQNAQFLPQTSAAILRLLGIIQQQPEFQQRLDALRHEWKTDSLIHGDMKWDNCLVGGTLERPDQIRLKVVDWELADIGDACWDVGAVLQAYLSCWIASIPATGEAPSERLIEQAQYPLEAMQPALRAFWETYLRQLEANVDSHRALLERSMRYGAARMIQTAYEWMYYSPQISTNTLYLLQVSLNILQDPAAAIQHLLGL